MTGQLERSPTERLWSEYRKRDGVVIRRVLPAPRSRLSPRTIATIRASRFDAGLLALLFDIGEDMVKSIRCGRRLARLGVRCKPIPDSVLWRMAFDVIRADTARMMREVLRKS